MKRWGWYNDTHQEKFTPSPSSEESAGQRKPGSQQTKDNFCFEGVQVWWIDLIATPSFSSQLVLRLMYLVKWGWYWRSFRIEPTPHVHHRYFIVFCKLRKLCCFPETFLSNPSNPSELACGSAGSSCQKQCKCERDIMRSDCGTCLLDRRNKIKQTCLSRNRQ